MFKEGKSLHAFIFITYMIVKNFDLTKSNIERARSSLLLIIGTKFSILTKENRTYEFVFCMNVPIDLIKINKNFIPVLCNEISNINITTAVTKR